MFIATPDGNNYTVENVWLENKDVNKLSTYTDEFIDSDNEAKVPKLTESLIRIGYITVTNDATSEQEDYLFILDEFKIELYYLQVDTDQEMGSDPVPKNYTFMLILPKNVIQNKIEDVNTEVGNDITKYFIAPFIIFSACMMLIIIYLLEKISTQITKPIIELQEKIK